MTVELNITDVKCIVENLKKCNVTIDTNSNQKEKSDLDEPIQNKAIDNYQNNNTNKNCDITCANVNLTKEESDLEKISSKQNGCSNSPVRKESENCKRVMLEFYQNLKFEIEKFNHILNSQPTIKHVAHLDIEASIKKELENTVAEFENKRINSPNPITILVELRTFLDQFKI